MGKLAAPEAGEYIFAVEALSSATLVIDGQAVVQTLQPNQSTEGRVTLTQGLHNITVRYQALDGHSHINLYWQPPGYGRQSLPAAVLFPPQGDHQRLQLPQLADLFVQSGATAPQASASVNDAGRVELPAEVRVVLDGLNQPRGVAVGDDGSIYIAETGGRRLFRIDEGGKIRSEFSGMPEALSEPFDLALDASGQVYLLDAGSGEILLFAADGRFLRYVGDERARFRHARGIAIDGQERLWVAHTPAGSLQRLSLQGEQLGAGVLSQEGDSQPVDVAVDAGDVVYVSDSGRNRLLLLSQNFQPLTSFDLTPANTVDGPHLAVSPNSLEGERPALYVSEPELGNLLKIAADSRQSGLYRLRNFGVQKPVGLAVDRQGRIWVADSAGGQVVVVIPVQ
jgi:sugar lactone lactonase YvrE